MVKDDVTFACLCSGRRKMYLMRNRREQCVYISDVLSTDMKWTAKTLTGFFIAAIRDAEYRYDEMQASKPFTWSLENPFRRQMTKEMPVEVQLPPYFLTSPLH